MGVQSVKRLLMIGGAVGAVLLGCWVADRLSAPQKPPVRRRVPSASPVAPDDVRRAVPEAWPDGIVLTPEKKEVPGMKPTPILTYRNRKAKTVEIAGMWDQWQTKTAMKHAGGQWRVDVRTLSPQFGRNEFKFIVNDVWEKGDNRAMFINEGGLMERPADLVHSAIQDTPTTIRVFLKPGVAPVPDPEIRLIPDVPIAGFAWKEGDENSRIMGYSIVGKFVTFRMDERRYRLDLSPSDKVSVAGSFNGWRSDAWGGWLLSDNDDDGVWEKTVSIDTLEAGATGDMQFKFVINGSRWLPAPLSAPNAVRDGKGNTNLRLDLRHGETSSLEITTATPLSLSTSYGLVIKGLRGGTVSHWVTPGAILDSKISNKPMGVVLDKANKTTAFRVFSPRAKQVDLCFYDGPMYRDENDKLLEPRSVHPMTQDDDGAWSLSVPGLRVGEYYSYRVDGPTGPGDGFHSHSRLGDPYARAVAHSANNAIVVDPDATNQWFAGWTDQQYRAPSWDRVLIYEAHVRDMSWLDSSGVPKAMKGLFSGIPASQGTGTGVDHLKKLGVNMIELLPVAEFENGEFEHNWGYATAYFFAPEASYGSEPLKGSQYYEFKSMVNELHRQGFGVILDVVYNHIGEPNVFQGLDRKYYFRQDQTHQLSNFSGCGNDVRTEAPMMRRLIVENILYWMREHHVDGFRFDLAELIDMETLLEIEREARALNPNVLLISEPWSFRGDHKQRLRGTGWSAWNDEFRNAVRDFVRGHGDRDRVKRVMVGSGDLWCDRPVQSINYLESHDDMCLADELSSHPKKDARVLEEEDVARNRLGATMLFTSLGIPMIAEGQEFVRSKRGIHNTYASGDEVNALEWRDRDRPMAAEALRYYEGLSRLRHARMGAPFRSMNAPASNHYRWIEPTAKGAIGYIVNGQRTTAGPAYAVLVNASRRTVTFDVDLPPGKWLLVGDGKQINPGGIAGQGLSVAKAGVTRAIKVPKLSAYIFMRR